MNIKMETENKVIEIGFRGEVENLEDITTGTTLEFTTFKTKSYVIGRNQNQILTLGRRTGFGNSWINEVIYVPVEKESGYFIEEKGVKIYRKHNRKYSELNKTLMEAGL